MTTFLYTTSSTGAVVTDGDAVSDLLGEYYFPVEPDFDGHSIDFQAHDIPSAFDVYETPEQRESVAEEFFERLCEYLDTTFEVKCVETQGPRAEGDPAVWKWVATPDGDVTQLFI